MDDFSAGNSSFDVIINSFDSKNIFKPQTGQLNTTLSRPLEFSAGIWEVGVKQLIFKSHTPKNLEITEIFKVLTDFTAPIYFGTKTAQILLVDTIPSEKVDSVVSFNYSVPTYVDVLKSYISSINILILDINDKPFPSINSTYPIIIRLTFQRRLTLI